MATTTKTRVVIYESLDRIKLIDELARRNDVSRAELYRRAMRLLLAHNSRLEKPDDHE
jgi:hypothetical protein